MIDFLSMSVQKLAILVGRILTFYKVGSVGIGKIARDHHKTQHKTHTQQPT